MSELKVPASNWILDRAFFEVELVDDFKSLYKEWYKEENGSIDDSVDDFILSMQEHPTSDVYQFPSETSNPDVPHDYFERYDDCYVIPRNLFNLI